MMRDNVYFVNCLFNYANSMKCWTILDLSWYVSWWFMFFFLFVRQRHGCRFQWSVGGWKEIFNSWWCISDLPLRWFVINLIISGRHYKWASKVSKTYNSLCTFSHLQMLLDIRYNLMWVLWDVLCNKIRCSYFAALYQNTWIMIETV